MSEFREDDFLCLAGMLPVCSKSSFPNYVLGRDISALTFCGCCRRNCIGRTPRKHNILHNDSGGRSETVSPTDKRVIHAREQKMDHPQ